MLKSIIIVLRTDNTRVGIHVVNINNADRVKSQVT